MMLVKMFCAELPRNRNVIGAVKPKGYKEKCLFSVCLGSFTAWEHTVQDELGTLLNFLQFHSLTRISPSRRDAR